MSNTEIITLEASKKGFSYNGNNIHTYKEWSDLGYQVKYGQRAFIKTRLWSQGLNRRKILVGLFTSDQIVKATTKDLILV